MNDLPIPQHASKTPLVWIDCEMTGLDPTVDELVEVAVIVTDSTLKPLAPGIDLLIKPSAQSLEQMSDFVRNMHQSSGLLEELEQGLTLQEAETQILDYIQQIVPQNGIGLLAGNSVGQDLRFLRAYMPAVAEHLHYRIIDVSTIKELAKRWYPRVFVCAPDKNGGHRALADIQDSIMELEYYRRALFPDELNPEPGFYHQIAQAVLARGEYEFAEVYAGDPEE